jgi:hypothetical protein
MNDDNLALDMDQVQRLDEEMDSCARRLDELNMRHPDLASSMSKEGVEQWRQRQIRILEQSEEEPDSQDQSATPDVKRLAVGLLADQGLEEVLDILLSKHKIELTMPELVDVIGHENYVPALKKDLGFLTENAVSYEQVAKLWRDLGRPALGGPEWNVQSVSALIG